MDDCISNESNHVVRWRGLFLLDASLVVGIQAWSLDESMFNHVDGRGRLFLLDANPVVEMLASSLLGLIFQSHRSLGISVLDGRKPRRPDL